MSPDLDAFATQPMSKLAVLRAAAREAVEARDAIVDFSSPEWRAAHEEAVIACHHANAELLRSAKDPKASRVGSTLRGYL